MSSVLRRLLVESDLTKIAAPRIGRLSLLSFDNEPIYSIAKKHPYQFFGSGGVAVFGVCLRAAAVEKRLYPRRIKNFAPERTTEVRCDVFLSQRVLSFDGAWASRREVIKYVANVASGVHSGAPREPDEILLAKIRRSVTYGVKDGMPALTYCVNAAGPEETPFRYSADVIDPVLIELLVTAQLLSIAPDIKRLESESMTNYEALPNGCAVLRGAVP